MVDVVDESSELRLQAAAKAMGATLLSPEETRREASRLLLDGWRMLQELCPISNYPLFLNKKNGEVWSVRLQMPVQKQADFGTSNIDAGSLNSNGSMPRIPAPAKTSDQIAKIIGQKLLLQWELLNEILDGVPLLRDPETGQKWSPLTEVYINERESLPQSKISDQTSNVFEEGTLSNPGNGTDDFIADGIADKLLRGWEMLNESCPVTQSCPLMRDPTTKRKWSAALNDFLPDKPVSDTTAQIQTNGFISTTETKKVPQEPLATNEVSFSELLESVNYKIRALSPQLRDETDLVRIKQIVDVLQALVVLRQSLVV